MPQADHRLSQVEIWVRDDEQTLQRLVPIPVTAQDFTAGAYRARLGDLLTYLSRAAEWEAIENEPGRLLLQVYELPRQRVRVDSTSTAVYHDLTVVEFVVR